MKGPEGGEWVLAQAASRRRDVPVRCSCGAFGSDLDVWQYWVGLVCHVTLCMECAARLLDLQPE